MNRDIFEGKWKENARPGQEWWANSPTTTWTRGGQVHQIIGLLRQKYGYSRRQANRNSIGG